MLHVKVGGIDFGNHAIHDDTKWFEFSKSFLGTATASLSSVIGLNTYASGNDFVMDNIHVKAVPELFTMVLGGVAPGLAAKRRVAKRTAYSKTLLRTPGHG